jgi:hypothetical protein
MIQRPTLYRQLRTFRNPHVARLTMQPGCLSTRVAWLSCLNVVLFLNALMLFSTAVLAEWGLTMAMLLMFTLVLPGGVLLAVVGVSLVAAAISEDTVSQQFEVIKTTTLTNWQLAGGYLIAQGLRLRTPYTSLVGGWLTIITTSFIALVLLDAYTGTREYNTRLFLTVTTLGVQNVGLNAMLLTMTLAVGLRFPGAVPLRFMMPFVAFAVSLGAPILTFTVLPELNDTTAGELHLFDRTPVPLWQPENALYLVLAVGPWLLAAGLGALAVRWVRRE